MGLRSDVRRFHEVGEERRQDLAEFIEVGEFSPSTADTVRVPVKVVDLPAFEYDPLDAGGVGTGGDGQPEVGQPVEVPGDPETGDGDGDGAGEGGGGHEYYEMDPAEFAERLDDELGLDLDPKGKQVVAEDPGPLTDVAKTGPPGTLRTREWIVEGLKRKLATDFDEEYVREALRVSGWDADRVFRWARERNVPVSHAWIVEAERDLPPAERDRWADVEEMEANVDRVPVRERIRREGIEHLPLRADDRRYRHPSVETVTERNVVVVNVRDVSGSMDEPKRDLVERTFAPMDWYLQGKYDTAEFLYVAHDAEAWEVERREFFGISSGGGTRISSAYELVAERFESSYPWSEWNRYVFAAGDGENRARDTDEAVIPLMESIDANLHAYVEVKSRTAGARSHADRVADHFEGQDGVAVASLEEPGGVPDAIASILSTEGAES